MEDFFDYASMALGLGFGLVGMKLVPMLEKARLARGDVGLSRYVERDGLLLDKQLLPLLDRPGLPRRVAMAFLADLQGSSLFMIAFIVLMLAAGPVLDDPIRPVLGALAALVYLWMFVRAVRTTGRAAAGGTFTAMLDALPDPTYFGFALASAKLADGSAFAVAVHWRSCAAFGRKGAVQLVLLGAMNEAGKALFLGLRPSAPLDGSDAPARG